MVFGGGVGQSPRTQHGCQNTANHDGGYASPVSTILQGFGSSTKASERVQRYIEQMVQTTVIWRPLAPGDAGSLTLDGFEAPASTDTPRRGDEARTFPLLAEARLYKRAGEWWVTWYYPPSIAEQIIDPDRWAQIELNSIARLGTYTAVALYEICARYKDSPGGLTCHTTQPTIRAPSQAANPPAPRAARIAAIAAPLSRSAEAGGSVATP